MTVDAVEGPEPMQPTEPDQVDATDPAGAPAPAGSGPGDAPPAPAPRRGPRFEPELLLALELIALSAFAFSRPVLDSFGRSPETFIMAGAGSRTIVLFGVAVLLIPAVVVIVPGLVARIVVPRIRPWVHLLLVAGVGGVAVWRFARDITRSDTALTTAAAVGGGLVLAAARWRFPAARSFLRFAGTAAVVFLLQFVLMSPTADLITGGKGIDDEVAAQVAASLVDDPPDVAVVVFDALPTTTLLDGTGHIDRQAFPNFGRLADDGTWYRNHTTVSGYTVQALPAILTGSYNDGNTGTAVARGRDNDENLFTLLGGSYKVTARELVTQMVPPELRNPSEGDIRSLLDDAVTMWRLGPAERDFWELLPELAFFKDNRFDTAQRWTDANPIPRSGEKPSLWFQHVVTPHDPWHVTDDGTFYDPGDLPTGFSPYGWGPSGASVGHQRHVLQTQAADLLLGQIFEQMEQAGTYDDTLIIVTADHGQAFIPEESTRALSEGNYPEIMWTPLLIKEPAGPAGKVVDDDVRSIDIVPTIADILGVEIPWHVDGSVAGQASDRDGRTKPINDSKDNIWRPEPGEARVEVDAEAGLRHIMQADAIEGEGPDAVWKRTAFGELFGQSVDRLDVGKPSDSIVEVEQLGDLDDVNLDKPLPLVAVGHTDLESGEIVAYALNGVVVAVTEVEGEMRPDRQLALAMLHPRSMQRGANELVAYAVSGTPDDPVLHQMTTVDG